MTAAESNAAQIFEDARFMRDAALERMAAGDIRDAAEKAWCATLRATEALVLTRAEQEPGTSTMASRRLQTLSMTDQSVWELPPPRSPPPPTPCHSERSEESSAPPLTPAHPAYGVGNGVKLSAAK